MGKCTCVKNPVVHTGLKITHQILSTGSKGEFSAEGLTKTGWQTLSTPFSNYFYVSCLIHVDDQTFLITGGQVSAAESKTSKSFIYNPVAGSIQPGPSLRTARWGQGCGMIKTCEASATLSAIVVGGLG